MKRVKLPSFPSACSDLFGTTETQPRAESGSHTARGESSGNVLQRMASSFRSLEAFRTLAWMRIERGEKQEAIEVLRAWEEAVRDTCSEYERLTS